MPEGGDGHEPGFGVAHLQHQMLQPREWELESPELLDLLLCTVQDSGLDDEGRHAAVSRHAAGLMAGIELRSPRRESRRVYSRDDAVRWVEDALGSLIDDLLWQLWSATPECDECARTWSLHLLRARCVTQAWAAWRG